MTDDTQQQLSVLEAAQRQVGEVLNLAAQVSEIPAPTFHEGERAAFVRDHFAGQGLEPWIDDIGNVYAIRKGGGAGTIMLSAHTDTVFPVGTNLTVRREGDRLIGAGIGDNSLSVAALLSIPLVLDEAGVNTGPDLLLCANVGEEGLGDLRGIRRAVADHRSGLEAVVAIEGHGLGRVINTAVGSRRLRISVEGPGGHSWSAFGNPSAIHVLGRIITAIADIAVPAEPKTTFNVGLVEGGVSVNTIAPTASLVLDLRSVDPESLAPLVARVEEIVDAANAADQAVSVRSEVIGDRPAGSIPADAPIVQVATDVLRELKLEPRLEAGSTDANIPIAEGIPAVCIGLTRGGHTHRTDEYIETAPLETGLQQLALLVTRLAGAERSEGL